MNWLAHTLLSNKHIDYQLGNVLADPLRGAAWQGASEDLIHGMSMHKAIDRFTDKHPILSSSKDKLGADGHLKGVVLDILFDHFLSQHWDTYAAVELDDFLRQFNQQAFDSSRHFPTKAKMIIGRMAVTNLLGKYQAFDGLVQALERIDLRLSVRTIAKESATQYIPIIENQYDELKIDFEVFFPELVQYFKNHQLGSKSDHYLL